MLEKASVVYEGAELSMQRTLAVLVVLVVDMVSLKGV